MAIRNLELALRIRTIIEDANNIDDLRRDMGGLADEVENAGDRAGAAGSELDDLAESEREAGRSARDASSGVSELAEGLKAFLSLAAAKEIIDLNDRLANLRRGFDVITGSQQGTADALDFVRGVADRLGVSMFDLSQSYLKLVAASKGTQLEGKATEQIFSSLSGALSTVGASTESVENALNAIAQMMSKGVVSAEELRGQLGDVLPGAAQQAAQSLLTTNAEFSKMLESGEVIASEFLPKFAVQLEQAMGGGGQQVDTFAAALSRLQNRLIDLATGAAGQALTRFATVLLSALEPALRGLEAMDSLIGAVGRALGGLAAGEAGAALSDFSAAGSETALNLVGLKSEAQLAAEQQKRLAEETKAAVIPIDALQTAVARGELKALPETLQAAVAELRKTGDAAAATEQAISKFLGSVAKNLNFDGVITLATSLKAVGQEAQSAGAKIQDTLAGALAKLSDEQLVALKAAAESAMASASRGSEQARKSFADLGLIVDAVANVQLKRAAEESDRVAQASRGYTGALEQLATAQTAGLRAEIDLANAKGQTWVAQQKTAELAQLEAQWTQAIAAAKQLEIAAEKASVEAKIAELQARAEVTDAVQREISALQLKMAALGQEAEAQKLAAEVAAVRAGQQAASASATTAAVDSTQQHTRAVSENSDAQEKSNASMSAGGGFAKAMADALNFARQQTEELSGATKRLFERMLWTEVLREPTAYSTELQKVVIELDKMPGKYDDITSKIAQMNATIRENQESLLFAPNSAARFIERLNIASAAAQKAWLEQKLAAEQSADAIERLANSGTASMHALDLAIRSAAGGYSLLDQQDMSRLNSALDQARSKLAALEEAARSAEAALSEMGDNFQRQILQAQGDQRRLLDLEHEDNLKRLEELHQKAGQLGGDEYAQAKARADALHSLKLTQLAAEEAAKRRQEAESRTPQPTGGGGGTGTAGATGGGTTSVTNNFYVDPTKLANEEWVRQNVIPTFDKVARLRR